MKLVVDLTPGAERKFKREIKYKQFQENGAETEVKFQATFVDIGIKVMNELMESGDDNEVEKHTDLLERVLVDLSGLYDAEGKEHEFSDALRDHVIDRAQSRSALTAVYFDSMKYEPSKETRRKN